MACPLTKPLSVASSAFIGEESRLVIPVPISSSNFLERNEKISAPNLPVRSAQFNTCTCELCHFIQEMAEADWVYDWIRKLADWESTRVGRHLHQVEFRWGVERRTAEVEGIRMKLATIQTQMVIPLLRFFKKYFEYY